MLNHVQLKSELIYDPLTGIFTWKKSKKGIKAGSVAGSINKGGYIVICFRGQYYYAHILAWFYMTSNFPKNLLDHKDGIRSNNSWENLREATYSLNQANAKIKRNNTTGVKGVSCFRGKYKAQCNGKYLGLFDTKEAAHLAYQKYAESSFGAFARMK